MQRETNPPVPPGSGSDYHWRAAARPPHGGPKPAPGGLELNPPIIFEGQQRGLPRMDPGQFQEAQNLIPRLHLEDSSEALPECSQASPRGLEPNPPTIIEEQQRGFPRGVPGQSQGA